MQPRPMELHSSPGEEGQGKILIASSKFDREKKFVIGQRNHGEARMASKPV